MADAFLKFGGRKTLVTHEVLRQQIPESRQPRLLHALSHSVKAESLTRTNDIFICLLKAYEYIEHFKLPVTAIESTRT
jgi:hypothetical protein